MLQEFDSLMDTIRQLIRMCYDALAPDATDEERQDVRAALAQWLNS